MLTQKMISTVEKQRLGFVATITPEGRPNVSPKGTFVVINDNTLAFGEIRSPNTLTNLLGNPAIEVNFVDPLARKGFRANGVARILTHATSAFDENIGRFNRWGELAKRIRNIVIIEVENAKPLTTPAYDDGATEEDLRKNWAKILLSQ